MDCIQRCLNDLEKITNKTRQQLRKNFDYHLKWAEGTLYVPKSALGKMRNVDIDYDDENLIVLTQGPDGVYRMD